MEEIDEMSALSSDPIGDDVLNADERDENSIEVSANRQDTDKENQTVIDAMLVASGIENPSKIKFATNDGQIVERDWRELRLDEKLRVAGSAAGGGDKLTDDEAALVNDMRLRGMSSNEYLDTVYRNGQNSMIKEQSYDIDKMSDDELYLLDAIARIGEDQIEDGELEKMLANAKADRNLYNKTIRALRKEYRNREDEMAYKEQRMNEIEQQKAYDELSARICDEIDGLRSIGGQEIELTEDDKNDLANFILTKDENGDTMFNKYLNDPKNYTMAAFWVLKGKELMSDMPVQLQRAYREGLRAGAQNTGRVVRRQAAQQNRTGTRRISNASALDVK